MKHKTITTLLLLCSALFTSCGSSMHPMMDKWGWTDKNPDPGPRFGDHTPPPVAPAPGTPGALPVASSKPPEPAIGTATSHISEGAIPPPPKASLTPEITLPKN